MNGAPTRMVLNPHADLIAFDDVQPLIERGALFVVNVSGGKDSQAMLILIREVVPPGQILILHAHLPEVEWPGTKEHIESTKGDLPLIIAQANKTFFEMVERRGRWPSAQYRQCTSDLKRGPIEREIRHYLKKHPEFGGLIVNCMGMRAQESAKRKQAVPFKLNKRNSKAGREWYDWLPIHDMIKEEVFATIYAAGQKPHRAYDAGMSRLSCCFCIMASYADIECASRLAPGLYKRYCETEKRIDHTFLAPSGGRRRFLPEVVAEFRARKQPKVPHLFGLDRCVT